MERFLEYWQKGWKVILMIICVNLSYLLLFIPVALAVVLTGGSKVTYYFWAVVVGIIFAPGLTYFVFKSFYGEQ
ncbi:MAG: hypothetical protein WC486_06170 [Candidatus Omnitrophota bacterium]